MARKADKNSIRQQAFKLLNKLTEDKREDVLKILMARFKIGYSYAATLYASHRTINKENGTMAKVYTVKDTKDGKPCTPYMKITNTFNPDRDASLTRDLAIAKYNSRLKDKMAKAAQL